MTRSILLLLAILLASGCASPSGRVATRVPWDPDFLKHPPAATWGVRTGLVQQVYYTGESYQGKPTRVFAWLGRPSQGHGPFPAVLLVHGGGGKAFKDWAEHWAKRGYVALAMDTAGHGPDGRLADGGPDQADNLKFREFTDADLKDMWTYHAVGAVLRGHALLASLPEVDAKRIAVTGISWGGYLTCIIAGVDHHLKAAVPVYGCGFLGENSVWKDKSIAALSSESRERWMRWFDPSAYLSDVQCLILFLNGSNDFAYPLDSYRKSYRLVDPRFRHTSVIVNLPHGHIWTFPEVDRFVDAALTRGGSFPRLTPMKVDGNVARAELSPGLAVKEATLTYSSDTGAWQKRAWKSLPAKVVNGSVESPLPKDRPLTAFFSVTTQENLRISSEHEEFNP